MTRRVDVRETYDRIASHFAQTRRTPWVEVERFLSDQSGTLGIDIGVGNARHAEVMSAVVEHVIGLDLSRSVLGEAAARSEAHRFRIWLVQGDAMMLPIRSGCIDVAVYVATLHHLPSRSSRLRSLNELARVLSDRGSGIVSAWSTRHEKFDHSTGFDTYVDWTLPDGEVVPRFYHIYDPNEFAADIASSALCASEVFVSGGNCYAIVTADRGTLPD